MDEHLSSPPNAANEASIDPSPRRALQFSNGDPIHWDLPWLSKEPFNLDLTAGDILELTSSDHDTTFGTDSDHNPPIFDASNESSEQLSSEARTHETIQRVAGLEDLQQPGAESMALGNTIHIEPLLLAEDARRQREKDSESLRQMDEDPFNVFRGISSELLLPETLKQMREWDAKQAQQNPNLQSTLQNRTVQLPALVPPPQILPQSWSHDVSKNLSNSLSSATGHHGFGPVRNNLLAAAASSTLSPYRTTQANHHKMYITKSSATVPAQYPGPQALHGIPASARPADSIPVGQSQQVWQSIDNRKQAFVSSQVSQSSGNAVTPLVPHTPAQNHTPLYTWTKEDQHFAAPPNAAAENIKQDTVQPKPRTTLARDCATPREANITLLGTLAITVEEILTFFPNHTLWPWCTNRLLRNGWKNVEICAYKNYARDLTGGDAFLANTFWNHHIASDDAIYGRRYTAKETRPDEQVDVDDLSAGWWTSKEGRNGKPVIPNNGLRDMPLRDLADGVKNWPDAAGRGPLTQCIEYALQHFPTTYQDELKLSDVQNLVAMLQLPLIQSPNADLDRQARKKHAMKMMDKKYRDPTDISAKNQKYRERKRATRDAEESPSKKARLEDK